MIDRILKAYRRWVLKRAIKRNHMEILSYDTGTNTFFAKLTIGKSTIQYHVYYRPADHAVVFDGKFYEHPDF